MTKKRDWITVREYATPRGMPTITVYKQIEENRFPHPVDRVEVSGQILIFCPPNAEPQKSKAKSQVSNLPGTTCDLAGTK